MSPRLRIAVLGARGVPSSYSGVERAVEGLYTVLAERGHDITVYARPEYAPKQPRTYRGLRVVGTPTIDSRAFGTASQVTTGALHIVRDGGYDLVHTHALAAGLVIPLLRRFRIPVVSTVHGIDWQRAKWRGSGSVVLRQAERWIVRHAARIIVISRDLETYYNTAYGRDVVLIPNATEITTDEPCDDALLARFGLQPQSYVVCVARLVPEKRIEDLIRAFRGLETSLKLAIVGGSSHTDRYVSMLEGLAADDSRVVLTGARPREEVQTFLRGASLYVLPSELEGMPISLLESLEMGVPSVVSRLPVHEELLGHTEGYDLFFEPRDVDALRHRIACALRDLDRYRGVAARAQAYVRSRYSWPAIADQTEALYRDVLDASSRSSGF